MYPVGHHICCYGQHLCMQQGPAAATIATPTFYHGGMPQPPYGMAPPMLQMAPPVWQMTPPVVQLPPPVQGVWRFPSAPGKGHARGAQNQGRRRRRRRPSPGRRQWQHHNQRQSQRESWSSTRDSPRPLEGPPPRSKWMKNGSQSDVETPRPPQIERTSDETLVVSAPLPATCGPSTSGGA
ncbi:uncharacterized protein LOC110679307 [Aedes aegypti]|uniref:Uncharacterized protein n=1 Tax=Aedes aegypti TaxID=7159 RepID=A0A6I8TZN5_AEDAE|nr:uncharacterized protein LOC110679307 [Aedes aegypti]